MDGATKEGSIRTALDVWSYPDWWYVLTKFDPIFGENSACWDEGLPPDRGLAFTKGVLLSNTPKKLLGVDWWKHCEGLCYFPFLVSKASLFDVSKAAFLVSLFSLWWSLDQLNLISFPRKLHRCTGFRITGKIEDCDLSPWFWRKIKFHLFQKIMVMFWEWYFMTVSIVYHVRVLAKSWPRCQRLSSSSGLDSSEIQWFNPWCWQDSRIIYYTLENNRFMYRNVDVHIHICIPLHVDEITVDSIYIYICIFTYIFKRYRLKNSSWFTLTKHNRSEGSRVLLFHNHSRGTRPSNLEIPRPKRETWRRFSRRRFPSPLRLGNFVVEVFCPGGGSGLGGTVYRCIHMYMYLDLHIYMY